jgi:hypothetical protein
MQRGTRARAVLFHQADPASRTIKEKLIGAISMALMKLAAGLAVGYVLGARAGRDKYEQIAATARKVSARPAVGQAQDKAKELVGTGTGASSAAAPSNEPVADSAATSPATPRSPRRKPAPAATAATAAATPAPPVDQPPLS